MEALILEEEKIYTANERPDPEYQNRLASLFHNALKAYPYTRIIFLKTRGEKDSGKFFKNKKECKERRNSVILKAYNEANSYFATDSSKSVAKEAASFYANFTTNAVSLCQKLEPYGSLIDAFPDAFRELRTLINKAQKNLLRQFQGELNENADYYRMYDLNYFIEQVDVEEHDYNLDTGDKVFDFVARLVNNNTEYTLEGLFDSLGELEDDLNKNAASFFNTAFTIYQDYCYQITHIAETIGNHLTDEDLTMLGILPAETAAKQDKKLQGNN